jgi:hypothetical protein
MALSASVCFPADREKPAPSALASVEALDQPVTYTETKIALCDLIHKVATDTGVKLTAAADVADEPVAVVVTKMPARELLEQLADLLGYRWSRHGKKDAWRYEIWQDLASKQHEEALRQAMLTAAQKQFQEQVKLLADTASLSEAQIRRLIDETEVRFQESQKLSPLQHEPLLHSPEEQERTRRWRAARQLPSPISRVLAGFLTQLTPAQWSQLNERKSITFSSDPLPGELTLPEETVRDLRTAQPTTDSRLYPSDPRIAQQLRDREQKAQDQWSSANGFRVFLRLDRSQLKSRGWLSLQADATPFVQRQVSGQFFGGRSNTLTVSAGTVSGLEERPTQETLRRQAELESDPVLGSKKLFKPTAKLRASPFDNSGQIWYLHDLLPDLARTYGVQFIADSYWSAPWIFTNGFPPRDPIALYALLDRYLLQSTLRWERKGNLIRLRTLRWFVDRPREVPLRLVRRWTEVCRRQAALPLEEYLDEVAPLRDEQLQSLENLLRRGILPPEAGDLANTYAARTPLRLYRSLSPLKRQALWQGAELPVPTLLPEQQASIGAGVQEKLDPVTPERLADWMAGSFFLTSKLSSRTIEPREETQGGFPPPRTSLASTPPAGTASSQTPAGNEKRAATHCPITELTFSFRSRGGESMTAELPVATAS